jgi:hypothetical protein
MSPWVRMAMADLDVARGWKDELLAFLFACCHPALEAGESAALALATVVGLSTSVVWMMLKPERASRRPLPLQDAGPSRKMRRGPGPGAPSTELVEDHRGIGDQDLLNRPLASLMLLYSS